MSNEIINGTKVLDWQPSTRSIKDQKSKPTGVWVPIRGEEGPERILWPVSDTTQIGRLITKEYMKVIKFADFMEDMGKKTAENTDMAEMMEGMDSVDKMMEAFIRFAKLNLSRNYSAEDIKVLFGDAQIKELPENLDDAIELIGATTFKSYITMPEVMNMLQVYMGVTEPIEGLNEEQKALIGDEGGEEEQSPLSPGEISIA